MENIFDCSDCLSCRKAAAEKAFEDARKVQEEASKEPKILFKQLVQTDISEKSYICIKCGLETRTRQKNRWHNAVVHGYVGKPGSNFHSYEKKYFEQKGSYGTGVKIECRVCEFTTIFRNEILQHIAIAHNTDKEIPLTEREKKQQYRVFLAKRLDAIFQCLKCDFSAKTKTLIKKHIFKLHSNTNQVVEESKSQSDFTINKKPKERKAPGRANNYQCPICEIQSKTKKVVKQHLLQIHGLNEKLECRKCDFTSTFAAELKKHMSVHKTKLLKCGICENFSGRKSVLGIHSRKSLLTCKKCEYKTHLRVELKAHKRKLHFQLACKVCNKGFKKVRLFDDHRLSNHTVKEEPAALSKKPKTVKQKVLPRKKNSRKSKILEQSKVKED